jgi:hypothetical protein
MDKRYLTAALLAGALLLFGCDNEADTVDTTQPAETANPDDAYIDSLRAFDVSVPDESVAIDLGHAVCTAWDTGSSMDQTLFAISPMDGTGLTAPDAGYVMGAASMFLCPEHLEAAQAWADA